MASLAVQRSLRPEPVEPAIFAPPRLAEAGDRDGASGRRGAVRDRVTISREARDRLGGEQLDAAAQAEVAELRADDQRVRAHERAHQAAGGGIAGGATFSYVTGPDGKQYAVAGEVPIRVPAGRTPDEEIANARKMRAAALAPADPSAQDLAVAAQAVRMEQSARTRKSREAPGGAQGAGARRAVDAYARLAPRPEAFAPGAAGGSQRSVRA